MLVSLDYFRYLYNDIFTKEVRTALANAPNPYDNIFLSDGSMKLTEKFYIVTTQQEPLTKITDILKPSFDIADAEIIKKIFVSDSERLIIWYIDTKWTANLLGMKMNTYARMLKSGEVVVIEAPNSFYADKLYKEYLNYNHK